MDLQLFADKVKEFMRDSSEGEEFDMDYGGNQFLVRGTVVGAIATLKGGNVEVIIRFDRTVKITEPWLLFSRACALRYHTDGSAFKCHHTDNSLNLGKCDRKLCPRLRGN